MLDIVVQNFTKDKEFADSFFVDILKKAEKELKIKHLYMELSFNLVGSEKIRTLNKKYRNKNSATDVLSFPLLDLDNPISTDSRVDDILTLGDIFISLPVARKKAVQEDKTIIQELQFLTVHGFLHLLGYDHERSKKDEKLMFGLQDAILHTL
jgi:probable rRNA maturation factor